MKQTDHIQHVAVIGIGIQGSMIAFRNALHGKQVTGYSRRASSIDTCRSKVLQWADHYVAEGKLTREEAAALIGRISYAEQLADCCREADLVIECIPEKLPLKQAMFEELDRLCPDHTLFNSNTSSYNKFVAKRNQVTNFSF